MYRVKECRSVLNRNFKKIRRMKDLMKRMLWCGLIKYLPVFDTGAPSLVYTVQRLVHNTGLWSDQSFHVHILAKICIICFLLTNLSQVAALSALVVNRYDPDKLFECFSVLSFCGMGSIKLFNLYLNKKRWVHILSQIILLENGKLHGESDLNCVEYDTDDEEEVVIPHVEKYTRRHLRISKLLVNVYSTTAVIFIVTPFIEYALQPGSRAYPHILPGWVPLDAIGFAGYFINIVLEMIASIYCVVVHVAFDCTAVGVMIFICGQFSLLREKTENIGGRGRAPGPLANRDTRGHFRIINSHGTHVALCNIIKELDTSLRTILGIYFLVATLTVCSVAIRLNSQNLSFMQLVSLLQYMCGTLTQLFLFCRYGDAVLHESSFGAGEGPSGAAWWGLAPRTRREAAMLGAGTLRARRLRAGPFNTLDLPSFVQIVRTAYSYYAVLGQTSK